MKYIGMCLLGLLLFAFTPLTHPAQAQVCAGYRTQLAVGSQGTVAVARLNLRPSPGTGGAPLVELTRGTTMTVVGGPTCAETLTWWQVQAAGQTGWVAEENNRGRLVAPVGNIGGGWQPPRPLPPSPEIAGGSNSSGGNGQVSSLCETNGFDGYEVDMMAFRRVLSEAQSQSNGTSGSRSVENGEFVAFTEFDLRGVLDVTPPLEICASSLNLLNGAQAVSENGTRISITPSLTESNDFSSAPLPPQALTQPGVWTLSAGYYTVSARVPAITQPMYAFVCCDGFHSSYTLLLGGFRSNERVIILQSEAPVFDDRLNLNNFVVSEVRTDGAGYYLGDLTTPFGLSGMMLFVGDQGSFVDRSFRDASELADLRARVTRAYLGGAPLPPPVVTSGEGLVWSLTPLQGSGSLSAGFWPDPFTQSVTSGGSVDVTAGGYGDACRGFASSAPNFSLQWSGTSGLLQFYFVSSGDTTLIVNDAHGNWWCDDDSGGNLQPLIAIPSPPEGQYDIWVGSFSAGEQWSGTLYVTEIASNRP